MQIEFIQKLIQMIQDFNPNWGHKIMIPCINALIIKDFFLFVFLILIRLFLYSDFQFLWYLFFATLILCRKEIYSTELKWMYLFVSLGMIQVFFVMASDTYFPFLVDGTCINRFVMHICFIAFYVVALVLGNIDQPDRKKNI